MGEGGEGALSLKELTDEIHEKEGLKDRGGRSRDRNYDEGENETPAASGVPKQPGVKWFH
jgi:hypothetical protein